MGTQTQTLAERVEPCYQEADWDALARCYAPDVILDVHVPSWRFQLQGRPAIAEFVRHEVLSHAGRRVTAARAWYGEDHAALQVEVRFDDGGEEQLWREVHLLRTDGAAIAEHSVSCTGIWDAATIARQAVEAPMVRP